MYEVFITHDKRSPQSDTAGDGWRERKHGQNNTEQESHGSDNDLHRLWKKTQTKRLKG